jgi:AraC-like DNA-binding protein
MYGNYALHFVLSGKGVYEIDNNHYNVKKGDMFMVPANAKMRYFPDKNDPWEYVWFNIKTEYGKLYAEALGVDKNYVKPIEYFNELTVILKELLDELAGDLGGQFTALSAFYKIMAICTQKKRLTGIQAVKKYIDDSVTLQEFNVERICTEMGISHAQLLRSFKAEYGTTVKKYVIKKRISIAADLLRTTDLSVKSVGYSAGFSDEAHFMKTFKNEMNMTALEYKNLIFS